MVSKGKLEEQQMWSWCSGNGLCFVIVRLFARILFTTHAADGGDISTHRPSLAHPQQLQEYAKLIVSFLLYST